MTDTKVDTVALKETDLAQPKIYKSNRAVPMDKKSITGRKLQIEAMLSQGLTWANIKKKLGVSENTISKVSKQMQQRFDASKESTEKILQSRMLATSADLLSKIQLSAETEDDLKTLEKTFATLFDRATRVKGDDASNINVNIQLANLFSDSSKTLTAVTQDKPK